MKPELMLVLMIIAGGFGIVLLWFVLAYNSLVRLRNHCRESRTPDIGGYANVRFFVLRRVVDGVAEAKRRAREEGVQRVEFFTQRGYRSRAMG